MCGANRIAREGGTRKVGLSKMMRWNFSSRARELSGGDALVLSIPKSGRTWLRVFVDAYFAHEGGRPFSLGLTNERRNGIPRIIFSHDLFEHCTKGSRWDRVRGKYLVPSAQTRAPVLLLVRDPRDAFVSYAAQLKRRNPDAPRHLQSATLSELLRHPRFGLAVMVRILNQWLREFGHRRDFEMVHYEHLRARPAEQFRRVLHVLGQKEISEAAFGHALRFSDFANMQRLEATGAFKSKALQPRDAADPESFKVRRGRVGGFRGDLTANDQRYAEAVCGQLDDRFGFAKSDRPSNSGPEN